ncbi:MAG TPA: hypothetical protein VEH48_02095 [Candidatus Nitrosopolaris sp.]|nr:hypothetical protein [Candidatus Nitrosopolaris sp.]
MRSVKKYLRKAWRAPLWAFAAAFLISSSVSVLALRHNNQTMIKLRNALYAADKNNGDVNAALNNLRNYVYAHMNTNLSSGGNTIKPPIQLKYTYQRLVQAQQQQLDSQNSQLYTQAEDYCQAQDSTDYYGYYRVPCVENYLTNHGLRTADTSVPAGLYEFDFLSPAWSPDLAGWSLAVSSLMLLLLIVKLMTVRFK